MAQADLMRPSGGQISTLLRLTIVLTTMLVLATACTRQAEDDGTANSAPSSASSISSTTVLQGTMTTEGPQAQADSTIESSQDAPGHTPDLAAFAMTVGAETVVAHVEQTLFIFQNGVQTSRPIALGWAWSDGRFVYESSAEGGKTFRSTASLLSGEVICDTKLPLHHATQRSDGSFVMAVTEHETATEDNWDGQSPYAIPTFAIDCQTGESQAIESFATYGIGETGYGYAVRVAGREFTGLGDAEGNADMVNEQGISLNGDDYAGYHTFSPDGSLVAYGDFTNSGSPHYTTTVRVRDTNSGALLWESQLAEVFAQIHFLENRVLLELIDPMTTGSTPIAIVVLDLSTGTEIASASIDFDLLYVGR